jgi:hypothetical protein
MKWTQFTALAAIATGLVSLTVQSAHAQSAPAQPDAQTMSADWRENYAYTVGFQAVIYGFPAVKAMNMWTCNGFAPVTYLITPPWLRMRAG